MKILITGAGGFLGTALARQLIEQKAIDIDGEQCAITQLDLADQSLPNALSSAHFIINQHQLNLSDSEALAVLWQDGFDVVFHLAAVVSGQAEQAFDLGYQVNLDVTRQILTLMRGQPSRGRFFMTSSVAVFGRNLPDIIPDSFPTLPLSCYGTQKAIVELLMLDYSRKGFCDGRMLRLPTICVRPGKPNAAASSFVSGIIREPLHHEKTVCPVDTDAKLWIMSPDKAIASMLHVVGLPEHTISDNRIIHPIGLTVSVKEMLDELVAQEGKDILNYIEFRADKAIQDIVLSWPYAFASTQAQALGFPRDSGISEIISNYKHTL